MVWTLVEPGVAIIASSLVTIRPLLRAWKIKGFTSSGASKQTGPFSNGQGKSRTNRSNGGMPGFGSRDVTLVDIELGHSKNSKSGDFGNTTHITSRSRMSYMSRISERANPSSRPDSLDATVTRRVEISREPCAQQSPETGENRETFLDGQSPSSSTIELTPETQHHERSNSDRSRGFSLDKPRGFSLR